MLRLIPRIHTQMDICKMSPKSIERAPSGQSLINFNHKIYKVALGYNLKYTNHVYETIVIKVNVKFAQPCLILCDPTDP